MDYRVSGGLIDVVTYMHRATVAAGYQPVLCGAFLAALTRLGEASFERRRDGNSEVCVPMRADAGNSHATLLLLNDPEGASALEDVIASVPPSDWAVAATVGLLLKPSLDRRPVGAEVKALIENAKSREATLGEVW